MAVRGTVDAEARRAALLRHATERGGLQLADAAALYEVHPMTIRRDFEVLEERGQARRVRGGILPLPADSFAGRRSRNLRAKQRIAEKLLPLVPAGGAVGLDASTTVFALVEALPADRPLSVVTNGLSAFELLQRKPAVRSYLTGGEREEHNLSLVGPLAESAFSGFHLDLSIVSAMAVHSASGTSESTLAQAAVKNVMARTAAALVLAVDAGKLETRSHVRALPLDRVGILVTELDPRDERLDPYRGVVPTIL